MGARAGSARVPAAARGRGTAAFAIKAGPGLVPEASRERPLGRNRRFSKESSSQNPSSAHPDPPTAPPRSSGRFKPRFTSDASSPRETPVPGPRERPAPPLGCCSGCGNRQGFSPGRRAPCPAPHSSGQIGAMGERRHRQRLSVPPQPGGQRPAFLGPLTCCWIFPSSVTTQWVVAAAGRVPEASSEHRPRAQPEKTHTRPSPPRPDAPAAAIFPNPGLLAAPGSGTAAAAILGAGGAARSGRCGRAGGRGGGGPWSVSEAVPGAPGRSAFSPGAAPGQPRTEGRHSSGGAAPEHRYSTAHRLLRAGSRVWPTAPSAHPWQPPVTAEPLSRAQGRR